LARAIDLGFRESRCCFVVVFTDHPVPPAPDASPDLTRDAPWADRGGTIPGLSAVAAVFSP
jgi:hypothetical protein